MQIVVETYTKYTYLYMYIQNVVSN